MDLLTFMIRKSGEIDHQHRLIINKSCDSVSAIMEKWKKRQLKSGSGKTVPQGKKGQKQTIAIAMSKIGQSKSK